MGEVSQLASGAILFTLGPDKHALLQNGDPKMTTRIKTAESHVKLAAPQLPPDLRSGGEKRPLGYPHLYQIQAGDWRISYAVEHNRLAILVLEVLNPEGGSSKEAGQDSLTKKMKIKLLDWPEGAGSAQIPPEELSKKMKIKWLDLADDMEIIQAANAHGSSRIKLKGSSEGKASGESKSSGQRKITLVDAVAEDTKDDSQAPESEGDGSEGEDRKVTPLDEPSM